MLNKLILSIIITIKYNKLSIKNQYYYKEQNKLQILRKRKTAIKLNLLHKIHPQTEFYSSRIKNKNNIALEIIIARKT